MTWSCCVKRCRWSTSSSTSISRRTLGAAISRSPRRPLPPGPPSSSPSPAFPGSWIFSITMSIPMIRTSSVRNCSSTPRHFLISFFALALALIFIYLFFFFSFYPFSSDYLFTFQVFYFDIGENRRGRFLKVLTLSSPSPSPSFLCFPPFPLSLLSINEQLLF